MPTIKNNFQDLKTDFKADTGLEYNAANAPHYIAYVHARAADYQNQIMAFVYQELCSIGRTLVDIQKKA